MIFFTAKVKLDYKFKKLTPPGQAGYGKSCEAKNPLAVSQM